MAIQIEQTFPRCRRCGKMIHTRAQRIVATDVDENTVVLCSNVCRDEYEALYGLADRGVWKLG